MAALLIQMYTRKLKELLSPRGPVISTLRVIVLLRVGERVRFPCDPCRCMSLSCVVKISCGYPVYADVLCYFDEDL